MREWGLASDAVSVPPPEPVAVAPRPLTAAELLGALDADLERGGLTRPMLVDHADSVERRGPGSIETAAG